jgi:hypothetical protein
MRFGDLFLSLEIDACFSEVRMNSLNEKRKGVEEVRPEPRTVS